jgi:hypothetical protein
MTSLDEILNKLEQNREELKKFGVKRLGVFGSFARNEALPESDIDFVVELSPKTFDAYMELKFFLEDLFNRGIDLVLIDSIKPRLLPQIEQEVIYAPGL